MGTMLDCRAVADAIMSEVKESIELLKEGGITPSVVIMQYGDAHDDNLYAKNLQKRCNNLGIIFKHEKFNMDDCVEGVGLENYVPIIEKMIQYRNDSNTHAILFLGFEKFKKNTVLYSLIPSKKDVDGIGMFNKLGIYDKHEGIEFRPCTAEAVLAILKHYEIPLQGRRVTLVGRSPRVGKPLQHMLSDENAIVTLTHSYDENLAYTCNQADIVISCVGKADLITWQHVNIDSVVIDVGIAYKDGKVVGDVAHDAYDVCEYYTPVPSGVGLVTNACMLKNIVSACFRQ